MTANDQKLHELIAPEQILDLDPIAKPEALRILSQKMAEDPRVLDGDALYEAILKREQQVSTGVGLGIAIPHVKIPEVNDYVIGVGRVKQGLDFESLDGQPVHLIFLIGASDRQTKEFVRILARVTYLLRSEKVRQTLMEAEIPGAFLDVIRQNER